MTISIIIAIAEVRETLAGFCQIHWINYHVNTPLIEESRIVNSISQINLTLISLHHEFLLPLTISSYSSTPLWTSGQDLGFKGKFTFWKV